MNSELKQPSAWNEEKPVSSSALSHRLSLNHPSDDGASGHIAYPRVVLEVDLNAQMVANLVLDDDNTLAARCLCTDGSTHDKRIRLYARAIGVVVVAACVVVLCPGWYKLAVVSQRVVVLGLDQRTVLHVHLNNP